MSASKLKQQLTTKQIEHIVKRYLEAYEDGWRPKIYATSYEDEVYNAVLVLAQQELRDV